MKVLLIFLQALWVGYAGLNVSTLYPFVVTTPPLNITALDNDLQNSFLVGLANGQARRYSPDFNSYTILAVPESVDKFFSGSFSLSLITLTNGTIWNMLGNMTATLSKNRTILRTYSYPAFISIANNSFSESIISYYGIPLFTPPNLTPLHLLIFSTSVKAIYGGTTYTLFDLPTTLGNGRLCTAAKFIS
jgi:hypothetical protein